MQFGDGLYKNNQNPENKYGISNAKKCINQKNIPLSWKKTF